MYVRLFDHETAELTYLLHDKVYKRCRPDAILGIAHGAFYIQRQWVDLCRAKNIACQDDTMLVASYDSPYKRQRPRILATPRIELAGKDVLILDDVADTGETLTTARDYVQRQAPRRIFTAALFLKAHSRFVPDFYCGRICNEWIIFPGEQHEDGKQMYLKWLGQKVSLPDIKKRFLALGYSVHELGQILEHEILEAIIHVGLSRRRHCRSFVVCGAGRR